MTQILMVNIRPTANRRYSTLVSLSLQKNERLSADMFCIVGTVDNGLKSRHNETSADSRAAGAHVTPKAEAAQRSGSGNWLQVSGSLLEVGSLGVVCSQTQVHLFKHLTKFYSNWLSAFAGGKTQTFSFKYESIHHPASFECH